MKRKEKENLIQGIGMKFDEATALFSDETLESMAMNAILGGTNADGCQQDKCTKDSPDNTKNCNQNQCGCPTSSDNSSTTLNTIVTVVSIVLTAVTMLSKTP